MKAYLALAAVNLKLALRERIAIFFNYIFPLIFFFAFGQLFHAGEGGAIIQVVTMVLVIGVLGNGLFGGGIRAVQDREQNILRRFKVAPISPAPMLVASMITGWALYIPAVVLTLGLARLVYGMPWPDRWLSLLVVASVGIIAFRAIGLIIAAVANSAQESQILVQLVYIPMLFLTGATFSITFLPSWARVFAQFLPATYLVTGMQGILLRKESLAQNWVAVVALLVTTAFATLISTKLFRWEKEEKLRPAAKLWLGAAVLPFLLLGVYQALRGEQVDKTRALYRELARSHSLLIRGARIFVGDGRVIETGAVLVKNGKIAGVFQGIGPDPASVSAEAIEGAGKTVLPGLIDAHVHLSSPGGSYNPPRPYTGDPEPLDRELAADLYSGVTTVMSVGDPLDVSLKLRAAVASGDRLGAELFVGGPVFTNWTGDGSGLAVRSPKTSEEARRQVDELKRDGVDAVQVALDDGTAGILRAIVEQAHAQQLPVLVRTRNSRDVADALAAGADGIECGSLTDRIPQSVFAEMARRHVAYEPTLDAAEGWLEYVSGNTSPLNRSLVQQVVPAGLLAGTRAKLVAAKPAPARVEELQRELAQGEENLRWAYEGGVMLVTGTAAGSSLVFHGPALHRELQLWVHAGVPARAALEAATLQAARLLRGQDHIGIIQEGHDANLLLVDGNPLQDITATERISQVIFKGERLDRAELFDQH